MRNRMDKMGLPVLAAALGALGYTLRRLLYAFALEDYRLLTPGHPVEWLLWAAVLLAAVLLLRLPKGDGRPKEGEACGIEGAGQILAAAGLVMSFLNNQPLLPGLLGDLWRWLGMASIPCLAVSGFLRITGKKGSFLLTMVPCLFLVAHLINFYQTWSSQPQLMNYVFSLLATIALAFLTYFLTAEQVDMGSPEKRKKAAFAAVFLCLTAQYQEPCRWMYLGGAAWALTVLWASAPGSPPEEGRL